MAIAPASEYSMRRRTPSPGARARPPRQDHVGARWRHFQWGGTRTSEPFEFEVKAFEPAFHAGLFLVAGRHPARIRFVPAARTLRRKAEAPLAQDVRHC